MSLTNGVDGPFIVELRKIYGVVSALIEQATQLRGRVGALEGQMGAVLPGWDAFNELEGRLGELESWVEDIGPRIKGVEEKLGVLESKTAWKYVGARGKQPEETIICFTQTSPILAERVPWEMRLSAVRLLVTKNYVEGGLDLDACRRTTDGRTIPPSLEEAIESLSTNKPMLMFDSQLRQLINTTAPPPPQGKGKTQEALAQTEGGRVDGIVVGAKEYLQSKPLSDNEEAVLGYIERNGGIHKDDIKALGAFVKGEAPRDVLLSLSTRGLIEKVDDEDGVRFVLTEQGEEVKELGVDEENPEGGGD